MALRDRYTGQVRLLVRLLPMVAREPEFALKGGTAINLFLRDLPRLSVDIDLVFLPRLDRPEALAAIDAAMRRIAASVRTEIPGANVSEQVNEDAVLRLLVSAEQAQVKLEISPVLRGVVHEPVVRAVVAIVEESFGFAEAQLVSFEDLYAGKLVAALDRQHPRDLFDVRELLANEGLTDDLREVFLVYLLSHNRPMGEVLSGRVKDLRAEYRDSFEGMTAVAVPIEELVRTQAQLIGELIGGMPDRHREFLIGFERGEPEWSLLELSHIADLPAVRWRHLNLSRAGAARRAQLVRLLEESLRRGK
jgi:predicted nucleotidyltransferase component of viral defense system